jgi:hypothetical protein
MFVRSISLRKLIQILFAPANRRVSGIRKDIREDMKRSQDAASGGGDFLRVLLSKNVLGLRLTGSGLANEGFSVSTLRRSDGRAPDLIRDRYIIEDAVFAIAQKLGRVA